MYEVLVGGVSSLNLFGFDGFRWKFMIRYCRSSFAVLQTLRIFIWPPIFRSVSYAKLNFLVEPWRMTPSRNSCRWRLFLNCRRAISGWPCCFEKIDYVQDVRTSCMLYIFQDLHQLCYGLSVKPSHGATVAIGVHSKDFRSRSSQDSFVRRLFFVRNTFGGFFDTDSEGQQVIFVRLNYSINSNNQTIKSNIPIKFKSK